MPAILVVFKQFPIEGSYILSPAGMKRAHKLYTGAISPYQPPAKAKTCPKLELL